MNCAPTPPSSAASPRTTCAPASATTPSRSCTPRRAEPGGDGGAVLKLTAEESRQWLGALNDLRLTIGTRLEITDEDESERACTGCRTSDPRKPMVMAYLWLGGLQETLIETLMP